MPKKKTQKKEESGLDVQKLLQNSDSYKSLIYGIVTVVVLFIVIALGVRTLSQNQADIGEEAASDTSEDVLTSDYVVTEGETLWSIAEKSYNDGYAWEAIAQANNLEEPYALEAGQKLTIPRVTATIVPEMEEETTEATEETDATEPTSAPSPTAVPSPTTVPSPTGAAETETTGSTEAKITANTYTIVEGDNLWTIAVRAYGDGYKWVEIARANSVSNPDLIYPGDTIELAR